MCITSEDGKNGNSDSDSVLEADVTSEAETDEIDMGNCLPCPSEHQCVQSTLPDKSVTCLASPMDSSLAILEAGQTLQQDHSKWTKIYEEYKKQQATARSASFLEKKRKYGRRDVAAVPSSFLQKKFRHHVKTQSHRHRKGAAGRLLGRTAIDKSYCVGGTRGPIRASLPRRRCFGLIHYGSRDPYGSASLKKIDIAN